VVVWLRGSADVSAHHAFGNLRAKWRDARAPCLLVEQALKRSFQRRTQIFDLPVCRMIALVPTPSARKSTVAARAKPPRKAHHQPIYLAA
jgi:hypothetical protein